MRVQKDCIRMYIYCVIIFWFYIFLVCVLIVGLKYIIKQLIVNQNLIE